MINQAILSGFIMNDIREWRTKDGLLYCTGSINVKRNYKDKETNHIPDDTFNFVAFGQTSTFLTKNVGKGDRVILKARLQASSYVVKTVVSHDGVDEVKDRKIYKTDLIVEECDLVAKAKPKQIKEEEVKSEENDEVSIYEKYEQMKPSEDEIPQF